MENEQVGWGSVRVTWEQSPDKTRWISSEGDEKTNEEWKDYRDRLKGTWVKRIDNDGNEVKIE